MMIHVVMSKNHYEETRKISLLCAPFLLGRGFLCSVSDTVSVQKKINMKVHQKSQGCVDQQEH